MKNLPDKRALRSVIALLIFASALLIFSGCIASDWGGEWNRTGDKTYSRSEMTVKKVKNGGFDFDMTLYNGNIAGELHDLHALFLDRDRTTARCDIADSDAYIDFTLHENGSLDLTFYSADTVEWELFEFAAVAYMTGNYEKGEVEYQNTDLAEIGVLSSHEDGLIKAQLTDSAYLRLLDCFQSWYCGEEANGAHDDDIGAFVYFGSNSMQENAAVIIIYDDGSIGVVISQTNGSLLYFSDNRIYGSGEVTPLPVKNWMERYNTERNG